MAPGTVQVRLNADKPVRNGAPVQGIGHARVTEKWNCAATSR
jgi:hypothetical protein